MNLMQLEKQKQLLSKFVYINYIILLIYAMISFSMIPSVFPGFSNLAHKINQFFHLTLIVLFVFQYLLYKKVAYKVLSLLFIIVSVGLFVTTRNICLFNLLFIPLFLNYSISAKAFYKVTLYTILVTTCIIFCLYFLNILPNSLEGSSENRIRYAIGFAHPNGLGFICVLITLLKFLIKDRVLLKDLFLYVLLFAFCFIYPNSITSCFILIIFAVALLLVKLRILDFIFKYKKTLLLFSILFMISTVSLCYFVALSGFGLEAIKSLSQNLASRFILANMGLEATEFTLFGLSDTSVLENIILDSIFFHLPICFGLIPTLFCIIIYTLAIVKAVLSNNIHLWICLMLIFFYGVSEHILLTIFFVFMFVETFSSSKK